MVHEAKQLSDSPEKKTYYLTTDDLSATTVKYFDPWLKLKDQIHDLKVTAFVVPCFEGRWFYESRRLVQMLEDNSSWIEVGVHGLTHSFPPEGLRIREVQDRIFKKAYDALHIFKPIAFRPPMFRFSEETFMSLRDYTPLKLFFGQNFVLKLREGFKTVSPHMVNSHTNSHCSDSISKIADQILELKGNHFALARNLCS